MQARTAQSVRRASDQSNPEMNDAQKQAKRVRQMPTKEDHTRSSKPPTEPLVSYAQHLSEVAQPVRKSSGPSMAGLVSHTEMHFASSSRIAILLAQWYKLRKQREAVRFSSILSGESFLAKCANEQNRYNQHQRGPHAELEPGAATKATQLASVATLEHAMCQMVRAMHAASDFTFTLPQPESGPSCTSQSQVSYAELMTNWTKGCIEHIVNSRVREAQVRMSNGLTSARIHPDVLIFLARTQSDATYLLSKDYK